MTFFLAMAEDPSWIPAGLTNTADAVEHMLKLSGVVGFAYVLVTGLSYRAGTRRGQSLAQLKRTEEGKPNLKQLPEDSSDTPFWKDNALLQGGFNGIFVMAILFSYVVIMLAIFRPSPSMLPKGINSLMIFPNVMTVVVSAPWGITLRKLKIVPLNFLIGLSILAAVLSVIVSRSSNLAGAVTMQLLLCAVQSAVISYFVGLGRGIAMGNLEERYPLVILTTSNGQTRSDLRLLKVGSSDCRFMEADGSVSMIPKSKIASIRTL